MNSISNNIKNYRKYKNLTQQQLADCLGVTHQTISTWESGRSMPNLDTLSDISQKLDVDINYLLYGKKADNGELKKKIRKHLMLFVLFLLFGIFTNIYEEYRLIHDMSFQIQSTVDLRYILPGRIYAIFIRPWVYSLPVFIIFSIGKDKGFIKDKADNKIYPLVKFLFILLFIYSYTVNWLTWGLSPVYNTNSFVEYIPVDIRVRIGNSAVFLIGNPALFSLIALICEIFRPFTNEKNFYPVIQSWQKQYHCQKYQKNPYRQRSVTATVCGQAVYNTPDPFKLGKWQNHA